MANVNTSDGEEGGGSEIFTCWNRGAVPTIFEKCLRICSWMGVHSPTVDLEALNKIKFAPFV